MASKIAQSHPEELSGVLRLRRWVGERRYLLRIVNLINKILIKYLGVKFVEAESIQISQDWPSRLLYWQRIFSLIEKVPGDIVECGCSWGSTLGQFAILCKINGVKRNMWGFDSFEGLPAPTVADLCSTKAQAKKGKFTATEEMVVHTLRAYGVGEYTIKNQITLVKGWFSDTLPKYEGSIALLRIDGNLYESFKTALENLWLKVSLGGIATFTGYHTPDQWPGVKKAVDEYFSQYKDIKIRKDPLSGTYFAIKTHELNSPLSKV